MTGPATPGQEGPTYAPPSLPEGWIAQWDGVSRKYYFVQLSTGASQWETPTYAASTGPTPQATPQGGVEHPYGTPARVQQDPGQYGDGATPGGAQDGQRGFGQMAMNQIMGGGQKTQSNNPLGQLGGLANQFLSGGHGGGHSGSNHSSNSSPAGIVGALAGSLLGGKKPANQQNYSGTQNQQSGAGGLMGTLGGIFGGSAHGSSGQPQQPGNSFGYSQGGTSHSGYTGSAPPASYQPSGGTNASYHAPSQPQQQYSHQGSSASSYGGQQPSYGAPPNQQHPSYGPPPGQRPGQYGGQQQPSYGGGPPQQPPYGGHPQHNSYGGSTHQQPPYPTQGGYNSQGGAHYGQHPPSSGNIPQPQHSHFQGLQNAEHSGGLYGTGPSAGGYPQGQQGGRQGW